MEVVKAAALDRLLQTAGPRGVFHQEHPSDLKVIRHLVAENQDLCWITGLDAAGGQVERNYDEEEGSGEEHEQAAVGRVVELREAPSRDEDRDEGEHRAAGMGRKGKKG